MKILMAYFSATGNTAAMGRFMTEHFERLGAVVDERDITPLSARSKTLDLRPYQAAVFGAPVHSLRAPRMVREWMRTLDGSGKKCATFFTYGGFRVHPCHDTTRRILKEQGFAVVATAEFLGAHTFNRVGWKAMEGRPNDSDFTVARAYVEKVFRRFSGADSAVLGGLEPTGYSEEQLDSFEMVRYKLIKQLPSRGGRSCSLCRLCEEQCPAGAFDAESGSCVREACIACLRCLQACPENVIGISDVAGLWPKKLAAEQVTAATLKMKKSRIYW